MIVAIIVIASFLGCFIISHFVVLQIIFSNFFCRFSEERINERLMNDHHYNEFIDEIFALRKELELLNPEILSIKSKEGFILEGRYFNNHSKKTIICFHGVHVNSLNAFSLIGKKCLENGFNVLIVDQRVHGLSGGKFITYGKYEHEDVLRWIDFISQKDEIEEIYLYGSSMGGVSICLAGEKITSKKVKAMMVDSAYCTVDGLVNHLVSSQNLPSFLFLPWIKLYARIFAKLKFNDVDTRVSLKKNKIPTLFIYGTADVVVTEGFLMDNYNACASLKEKLVIKGASHTLAMNVGGDEAFNKMFKFIGDIK